MFTMPVTAFSNPMTCLLLIYVYLIYFCFFKEALSLQFYFIIIFLQAIDMNTFRISHVYITYLYLHA